MKVILYMHTVFWLDGDTSGEKLWWPEVDTLLKVQILAIFGCILAKIGPKKLYFPLKNGNKTVMKVIVYILRVFWLDGDTSGEKLWSPEGDLWLKVQILAIFGLKNGQKYFQKIKNGKSDILYGKVYIISSFMFNTFRSYFQFFL